MLRLVIQYDSFRENFHFFSFKFLSFSLSLSLVPIFLCNTPFKRHFKLNIFWCSNLFVHNKQNAIHRCLWLKVYVVANVVWFVANKIFFKWSNYFKNRSFIPTHDFLWYIQHLSSLSLIWWWLKGVFYSSFVGMLDP